MKLPVFQTRPDMSELTDFGSVFGRVKCNNVNS